MTEYRDSFQHCPRCAVDLEQAGSARGCRQCQGVWIEEPILDEMVRRMRALTLAPPAFVARDAPRDLPCPQCTQPLAPVTLEDVAIDRCERAHGVWFDREELQAVLYRVGRAAPDAAAPDAGVPDVKTGFWGGLLGAIGGLLGILGYGVAGVVATPVVVAVKADERDRRR